MKTKDLTNLMVPIYKINKICAIHYVGLKNRTKKDIFGYSYENIQNILKYSMYGIKYDTEYFKKALIEYDLLKINLDIAHEVKAISNGLFANLIPLLANIKKLLQSFTDEDN